MSSVPRHSEEELRQQWAFLDALVDRQAASLKSGIQDPEEDDLTVAMAVPDPNYLEEISTLTRRVTTLEDERTTLLRRIDLAEEARMAAESGRAAAEAARQAAEQELAEERTRLQAEPAAQDSGDVQPVAPEPAVLEPVAVQPVAPEPVAPEPVAPQPVAPAGAAPRPRRKTWWQRIRE